MKLRLALSQVNNSYGSGVFQIPLAVGDLWAYARQFPEIKSEWEDPIFLYKKESISKALARLGDPLPDLIGFSDYVWNSRSNHQLAKAIKEKSPSTTILFGGVNVPDKPHEVGYYEKHLYIDFAIHGEGEEAFACFLRECTGSRNWSQVPNLSNREFQNERKFVALDKLRSPYLDGVFSSILNLEERFNALHETNRGCPY